MITLTLSNLEVAYLIESLEVSAKASPMDKSQFEQMKRIIEDAVKEYDTKSAPPKIVQIQAFQPTEKSWHALIGLDDKGQCYSRTLTNDGWSEWIPIEKS